VQLRKERQEISDDSSSDSASDSEEELIRLALLVAPLSLVLVGGLTQAAPQPCLCVSTQEASDSCGQDAHS